MMCSMRNTKAKKIRKILGLDKAEGNPILKRTYRRMKRLYSRTPENQKAILIQAIKKQFNYEQ